MYYLSIHSLFASIVAAAAWTLTSTIRASATTKYWIWIGTAFNFVLPTGAFIDKLWAPHFPWAYPLGAIGGPIWDMTQGRTAVILAITWLMGVVFMLARLITRICREHRDAQMLQPTTDCALTSNFLADGIPVSFGDKQSGPAVRGVLNPRILLPVDIERILDPREFHAVLIHELAHARRRDNLIRLLYEGSLCVLWFNPLFWLAGARNALYRELSCDESVVRRSHGPALVSALAKLAVCEQGGILQATASSHLGYRLALLAEPAQNSYRAASLLVTFLFAAVIAGGVFQTVAHTA